MKTFNALRKPGSGGSRPGSGRKPMADCEKKIQLAIRLPPWIAEWLREQPSSMPKLIEAALVAHYDLSEV